MSNKNVICFRNPHTHSQKIRTDLPNGHVKDSKMPRSLQLRQIVRDIRFDLGFEIISKTYEGFSNYLRFKAVLDNIGTSRAMLRIMWDILWALCDHSWEAPRWGTTMKGKHQTKEPYGADQRR